MGKDDETCIWGESGAVTWRIRAFGIGPAREGRKM